MAPTARDLFDDLLERIHALDRDSALRDQDLRSQVAAIRQLAEALDNRVKGLEKRDGDRGYVQRVRDIAGRPEAIWAAILLALAVALLRMLGIDPALYQPPGGAHAPAADHAEP